MSEKKPQLIQGNEACVKAAIAAGIKFFAGYPITPSSEIAEGLAEELPKVSGRFIQMEDEIASMGAIIGGSLAGAKSMTATSGPGFSLKQENLGFAAMAEVPCVVVNVQRGGPSTGAPTLPSQGDMMQAKWGTHGDHPAIALCPASVRETFDLTVRAINLSEKYRTPVVLLIDEVIGHMRENVVLPTQDELEIVERKKPAKDLDNYLPYKADDDMIPPMANYGEGYLFHVTGLSHDETGFPDLKNPDVIGGLTERLVNKVEDNKDDIVEYSTENLDDAEVVIVAYGSAARTAATAMDQAREKGIKTGLITLKTIWPFPEEILTDLLKDVKTVVVPEMNLGQIKGEIKNCINLSQNIVGVNRVDGELITPAEILEAIVKEES
ncbi:2-oxoacid:acceptor oxidoreductase subunit alpha [Natranaerofaba carboxydovora]|uniref:2-oxoacid:acceptor oxidoreductase subunit alpha n=1 Tax=Natranaerofaba carboxydovora TaxID=2742683 RepID=UPI001F1416C3|nr:2-oxoacid:acceptor oxidoreductase subunit alpha [Natranaerofaba carboxydovora]UMZ73485.1 2-oxoglutarate oxidoreductase subunit KorA [Natranaerofaba carboxydovora]UMZ73708.1 2-oxoglutarate oxidoreductase subunit KorA [Natranaerofaba carboxydovora]